MLQVYQNIYKQQKDRKAALIDTIVSCNRELEGIERTLEAYRKAADLERGIERELACTVTPCSRRSIIGCGTCEEGRFDGKEGQP